MKHLSFLILIFSFYNSEIITQTTQIQQINLQDFIAKYPETILTQCTSQYPFSLPKFPVNSDWANKPYSRQGYFKDIFIIHIPYASAYINLNYPLINDYFIKETQLKNNILSERLISLNDFQKIKLKGKLVILSDPQANCYGHWMLNILCQLALLELQKIEYDYLCIPYEKQFMKDSLKIWGVDDNKIIPLQSGFEIQADTIIIPTLIVNLNESIITNTENDLPYGFYIIDFLLKYVSQKLLSSIDIETILHKHNFSKKIFISRQDAPMSRRLVSNEDQIFKIFKDRGFKRYKLTELSFAEAVALFYQAESIISFVGSGSSNIIFSKKETHYIELHHELVEATYFYIANLFGIQYFNINGSNHKRYFNKPKPKYLTPTSSNKIFDLDLIYDFLQNYPEL